MSFIFADKLVDDVRQPAFTFSFPGVEGTFGLLAPSLSFWMQLTVLLIVQACGAVVFAIVTYKYIVQSERRGSLSSYLVGYGVIIPLAMMFPYKVIQQFDLRSRTLMMSLSTMPTAVVFRCLEALYGFSPPAVTASLRNYCIYYASVVEFVFDPKTKTPVPITSKESAARVRKIVAEFLLLSMLYSMLLPFDMEPFDTPVESHTLDHGISDVLHLGHLVNNFIAAVLTCLCLSVGIGIVSVVISSVSGFKTIEAMKNPIFLSSSPSDFWGRRWNLIVQFLLKRAVFKPVRKYFPFTVASAVTFVASGLLHEYVWTIIFFNHNDDLDDSGICSSCFYHIPGKTLSFFAWNGVIIVMEYLLGGLWLFQFLKRTLPVPLISLLVVLTALPLSHWFTGDWIKGGYFEHFRMGLPIIVKLT